MTGTNGDDELGPEEPDFAHAGPRDWDAGDEPADGDDVEGGFVPPDPGPVLGDDPLLTMAWAGVIAVPLVLVASTVRRQPRDQYADAGLVAQRGDRDLGD